MRHVRQRKSLSKVTLSVHQLLWGTLDQMTTLSESLMRAKTNRWTLQLLGRGRRHLMTTWRPRSEDAMPEAAGGIKGLSRASVGSTSSSPIGIRCGRLRQRQVSVISCRAELLAGPRGLLGAPRGAFDSLWQSRCLSASSADGLSDESTRERLSSAS